MKKKIVALMLLLALTVTAAGCGSGKTEALDTEVAGMTEAPEHVEESETEESPVKETEAAEEAAPETEEPVAEISEEDKTLICDTLQAIYDVQPGTSGSSLREMIAVGMLLDLSETLTDQVDGSAFTAVAADWAKNNEEIEGGFDEAYMEVKEMALDYISNPSDYEGALSDCGYEFTHDSFTQEYLEYVCNYIEISRSTEE